ncbi:MAG: hypothetical protein WCF57_04705, partial [Pyrinomonadaceae bacterium]
MADSIMKRMNYFDHQFLRAKDFNDEQNYHLSRRYLHNRVLHAAGIAQGLQVRKSDTRASAVVVDSGVAIDEQGREIILAQDRTLDLPDLTAGAARYLYIQYEEKPTDSTNETGTTGSTRWTEEPIVASAENRNQLTSTQLFLARVSLTAEGDFDIDMTGRVNAGLANDDLSVRSIRLKKEGVKESAWPRLSCSAANEASLGNGSLSIDDGRELVFKDNGQIRSFDDAHKIVFNRPNNRLELREFGTISFYTGSPATERLTLLPSGNVGIGTNDPKTMLEVSKPASNAQGGTLRISNPAGGAGSQSALEFVTYGTPVAPPVVRLLATDDGSASAHLDFQTKTPGAATNPLASRLRIGSDGKVNIGSATSIAPTFPPEVTKA